jgi:hypothetical protein
MLRTFKVYRFVIPNRREYRQLIRELADGYQHEKVIFEISGIDFAAKETQLSYAEILAESATMKRIPKMGRFAFVRTWEEGRISWDPEKREVTGHYSITKSELVASNLDASIWTEPNLAGVTDDVAFDELDTLLKGLSRMRFSTALVGFDGIPWFGESAPATWGYQKAKAKYDGGSHYLSSSLIVSAPALRAAIPSLPPLR